MGVNIDSFADRCDVCGDRLEGRSGHRCQESGCWNMICDNCWEGASAGWVGIPRRHCTEHREGHWTPGPWDAGLNNQGRSASMADVIATMTKVERERRLFGLLASGQVTLRAEPNVDAYLCELGAGGWQLGKIAGDACKSPVTASTTLVKVRLGGHPFEMIFAKVKMDEQSRPWDLALKGKWFLSDTKQFLLHMGLNHVSEQVPLTAGFAQSWMANMVRNHVVETVREHSLSELHDNAIPRNWWQGKLNREWLNRYAIQCEILEVQWRNADAAQEEAEKARRGHFAQIERWNAMEREAERRAQDAVGAHKKELARIRANVEISEKERAHQLTLLEFRIQKEQIEAQSQVDAARYQRELATLQHEKILAEQRNDIHAITSAGAIAEQLKKNHETIQELVKNAQVFFNNSGTHITTLHQAAEHLTSSGYGFSPQALSAVGMNTRIQSLVARLREKAAAGGSTITLNMPALLTRDIGPKRAPSGTMPINSSLRFEMNSPRAGHATLLNIGTSGNIYLHIPNVYIRTPKVQSGKNYSVPGPDLLPWDKLERNGWEYVEVGPPGWEHLVLFVSDEPLVDTRWIGDCEADCPIVPLDNARQEEFFTRLDEMTPDSWTCGVLSFLVE